MAEDTPRFDGATDDTVQLADDAPTVAGPDAGAAVDGNDAQAAPVNVGPYVVVRRLGAGGMGVVYECMDERLQRTVAVKLVRPGGGADVDNERARLLREARAIARISHPNVVEVFDVGTVAEDVFIAMELVEGPTLRQWNAAATRAPGEVVAAFIQIAKGLDAAHRCGVVHRDFKPDNVIMADDGRPRVLDFGIAQAHGEPGGEGDEPTTPGEVAASRLTADGLIIGTPAYMAPEQANGERVDARSDQFSFCVALFESLHGRRPFRAPKLADRLKAIKAGIVDASTDKPIPAHVRRALIQGLAADPTERHADMNALVAALAPSSRWGVALCGGVAALCAVGIGLYNEAGSAGAADPCEDVTEPITAVWNHRVEDSIREAFAAALPVEGENAWSRASAAVDAHAAAWSKVATEHCQATHAVPPLEPESAARSARCLKQRTRELSAILSVLTEPDATSIRSATKAVSGLTSPRECVSVGRSGGAAESPETSRARDELARAHGLLALGKLDAAADRFAAAMVLSDDIGDAAVRADAHLGVGELALKQHKSDDAVEHFEQAAFLAQEANHERTVVRAASQLMYVHGYMNGHFEDAERWDQVAQASIARMGGSELLEARLLNSRGAVRLTQGDYEGSLALYQAALATLGERLGTGHPKVQSTMTNVGTLHRILGDHDAARRFLADALAAAEATLGPDHIDVAQVLVNLAILDVSSRKSEPAIALLLRAVKIYEGALGPSAPPLAVVLNTLAVAEAEAGQMDAAITHARRSVVIARATMNDDAPHLGKIVGQLGDLLRRAGELEEGLAVLREAMRIKKAGLGEDHPDLAATMVQIATALSSMNRGAESAEQLRHALRVFPEDSREATLVRVMLAEVELERGEHELALSMARQAIALLPEGDEYAVEKAMCNFTMARALAELGRQPGHAITLATQAHAVLRDKRPENAAEVQAWLAQRGSAGPATND